jgi:hypothetical protein
MFYPIPTQFRLNRQAMGGTNYDISVDKSFMKEEYHRVIQLFLWRDLDFCATQ